MKKMTLLLVLLVSALALRAQSLEEGYRYIRYERYASAIGSFRQAIRNEPDNDRVWYALIKSYVLNGQEDRAADTVRKMPAAVQASPFGQAAMGMVLLTQGKGPEASALFEQAIDAGKGKDAGLLWAVADAQALSKGGDPATAVALYLRAIDRDKKNADLWVALGNAYRKVAKGSEAYEAYREALNLDAHHAGALHQIGELFLSQKNPELYLDYFKKAIAADPEYAPSYYKLYVYEFLHDPAKAMAYYRDYAAKSDPSVQHVYNLTDLLYLNREYDAAIRDAAQILHSHKEPRLYKLIAYSYAAKKDTAKALGYLETYFAVEADSNQLAKDHLAMASFLRTQQAPDSVVMAYLQKGAARETDSAKLADFYRPLYELAARKKDFNSEAKWRAAYYTVAPRTTNLDLFYWGLAHFRAEAFEAADSVFGIYVSKYPEQSFGYYWQAKSKALADSNMHAGIAVPVYEKLIALLEANPNDANYKTWMVEAYSYLAAYEANRNKDKEQAVEYLDKVLDIDPQNETAKKYISILEKEAGRPGA